MSRVGRKRKQGPREQNGRLYRIKAAEREVGIVEKVVVLSQPHRRGEDVEQRLDQKLESPLGRFVLNNKLRPELYDAGLEYGVLVRHFHAAKGVPAIISEGSGSGGGVSPEKARWLERELDRLEKPLKKLSAEGLSSVRMLAVHEAEISLSSAPRAIDVLYLLAVLLKKLGRRR